MLLVAVAQLVERRPVEANVAGSNPVSHPLNYLAAFTLLLSFFMAPRTLFRSGCFVFFWDI